MAADYAFFKGGIVPIDKAKVGIRTHALQYGTACFEGIRGYWNKEEEQLYILHLEAHYRRFLRSCKILKIDLPYSLEELCKVTVELADRNGYREDAYIRPLAYKSSETISPRLHNLEGDLAIYMIPLGDYIDTSKGVRTMVSSWRRVADNAIPARGKITGSYINSAFAKTEAAENGFDEAIVLTEDGHVCEGSAENIFLVRYGKIITPPLSEDILEGVTRDTIIQIAKDEIGIETVERKVDRTELYVADELFFCGTGAQVSPIIEVDRRAVGDGKPGPITSKISRLYFDIVRGKVPKYHKWLTPVYSEKHVKV